MAILVEVLGAAHSVGIIDQYLEPTSVFVAPGRDAMPLLSAGRIGQALQGKKP